MNMTQTDKTAADIVDSRRITLEYTMTAPELPAIVAMARLWLMRGEIIETLGIALTSLWLDTSEQTDEVQESLAIVRRLREKLEADNG